MDGTLVDSEKTWQMALEELAAALGGELSRAALASMIGTTTPESIAILYADIDQAWRDPDEGAIWLEDRVKAVFRDGLAWQPGARELLAAARAAGLKTALVTATVRHVVEVMLDTIGRHNFDLVVTDDDVTCGKPDPEPYASAAARLDVDAGRCVVIEDSPTGIASALAAGCRVVAVPAEVDLSAVIGVTHVRSLTEVDLDLLRALVRQPRTAAWHLSTTASG